MIKRYFLGFISFILLVAMAAPPVQAGGWKGHHHQGKTRINWKVSGTIANVTFYLPIATDPYIQLQPGILVNAVTKGAPGNAQFTVVGWTAPGDSIECNPFPQFDSLRNDMVVTFADQSMLFATLDPDLGGYVCNGPPPAVFNMIITGGTGRFEGAEGHFTGTFIGIPIGPPVYPLPDFPGAFLAETGTIEGWIER